MIKIELTFSSVAEAAAALAQLNGQQLGHTAVREVAGPNPSAEQKREAAGLTPPKKQVEAKQNVVPLKAATGGAADTPPSAATAPTAAPAEAAEPSVSAEQISAAIVKFVPVPEHKEAALAVLATFGVKRGKDLSPLDRPNCLAALKLKARELGLEL